MGLQTAAAALLALQNVGRPEHVATTEKFFKTYPGGYSEGDKFLCAGVPATRRIAKEFRDLSFNELELLIDSEWHDARLLALIILVERYKRADSSAQRTIYDFYMSHIRRVNNWDLVDSSAGFIVGSYLEDRPEKLQVLQTLAASKNLWERRIAMVATFDYIKKGKADDALVVAKQLLYDEHDLIQKAVGWMLREVGKRVDRAALAAFLDKYASTMPRTSLRYAIEHFPPERRAYYRALRGTIKV